MNIDIVETFDELAEALDCDIDALTAISAFIDARKNVHDVAADCRLVEVFHNFNDKDIVDSLLNADIIRSYLCIEVVNRLKALKQFDKAYSDLINLLNHYDNIKII